MRRTSYPKRWSICLYYNGKYDGGEVFPLKVRRMESQPPGRGAPDIVHKRVRRGIASSLEPKNRIFQPLLRSE